LSTKTTESYSRPEVGVHFLALVQAHLPAALLAEQVRLPPHHRHPRQSLAGLAPADLHPAPEHLHRKILHPGLLLVLGGVRIHQHHHVVAASQVAVQAARAQLDPDLLPGLAEPPIVLVVLQAAALLPSESPPGDPHQLVEQGRFLVLSFLVNVFDEAEVGQFSDVADRTLAGGKVLQGFFTGNGAVHCESEHEVLVRQDPRATPLLDRPGHQQVLLLSLHLPPALVFRPDILLLLAPPAFLQALLQKLPRFGK
jgi:hypothetical protein